MKKLAMQAGLIAILFTIFTAIMAPHTAAG